MVHGFDAAPEPSRARAAVLSCAAGVCLGMATASGAIAQDAKDFPSKPIRMIVPFPPGGSSDIIARITGQKMTEAWGQPVLVDSRPGAGGSLGTDIAARTAPDGYTVLVGNAAPISTNPLLIKVAYDTLRDFAPVTLVARAPQLVVVHPSIPVKSMKELMSYAKAQNGKVNYGSSGVGTIAHLSTEMFKNVTGIDMAHITYKGMPLVMNALVAGEVDVVFSDMAPAMQQVKTGRVRPIATTGGKRSSLLPDMPAVSETLPGFDISNWWGLFVPARTPQTIIAKMNQALVAALASEEVKGKFSGLGVEAVSSTPDEMLAMVKSEIKSFGALIKAQNIKPQ